ncbi:MAG: hypothetical protein GPOALKHO_001185 [Sodalis sp.]|nr:MAG: hypothetical protein GPOALKHO_001185 [Sodalis sp.]
MHIHFTVLLEHVVQLLFTATLAGASVKELHRLRRVDRHLILMIEVVKTRCPVKRTIRCPSRCGELCKMVEIIGVSILIENTFSRPVAAIWP